MVQAFDHGPWPRMSGRQRGNIMHKLATLMEVKTPPTSLSHLTLPASQKLPQTTHCSL